MTSAKLINIFNLLSKESPTGLILVDRDIGLILAMLLNLVINSAGLAPFTVSASTPSLNINMVGTAEILYRTETSGTTSASILAK